MAFWEKVLAWRHKGTRLCEICGLRVPDVEVPNHTTAKGGQYVHPFHVIMSARGRKIVDQHAR